MKILLLILGWGITALYFGEFIAEITDIYKDKTIEGFCFRFLSGTFLIWSLFEVVAVPCIIAKMSFNSMFIIYMMVLVVIAIGLGIGFAKRLIEIFAFDKSKLLNGRKPDAFAWAMLIVMLILVGYQVYHYAIHTFMDDDDARFVVEAVDALTSGRMLLVHPASGELLETWKGELRKDVQSPWPMFIAVLAKASGVHPTIVFHLIIPIVVLPMVYMTYFVLGSRFFDEVIWKASFVTIIAALVNMFASISPYSQASFTMIRIWQGKSIIASLSVPMMLLFYQIYNEKLENKRIFALFFMFNMGSSMLSSMGVVLNAMCYAFLGAYYYFKNKKWKDVIYFVIAALPLIMCILINKFIVM